jgi:hypothetical protein
MDGVSVAFLGGPHDGRVQTFPVADDTTGLPAPVLEVPEPTASPEEYRRAVVDGEPTAVPSPVFRTVAYRLAHNPASTGPLLFYVHPSVRLPLG